MYKKFGYVSVGTLCLFALVGCPSGGVETVPDKPPVEKPEEPTLPPVPQELIDASNIEEFDVDGLKVILKPTPGKSVVSAELFIKGGVANLTPDNAGVEELTLQLVTTGGTKTYDRAEVARRLQSMGSGISRGTGRDYSTLNLAAIKPYFDQTWKLFASVITEPAFDEKQFELEKARALDGLKAVKEDPDSYVGWIANELHFAGHPYAVRPAGKAEAVDKLGRGDLEAYYDKLLTRDRLLLVVVGDVTAEDIRARVESDLASIPKGEEAEVELPAPEPGEADVIYDKRDKLPTNYLLGFFKAPPATHPDYYPMRVAMSYLADRLFEEVRTKRNLTYAVSAGMGTARSNYGYLYVTAVDPTTTVGVMYDEVKRLAERPLTDKELTDLVNVFLTEYYVRLETNAAQAGLLGRSELYGGGWERTLVFIDSIKKVTPEQVQRVAAEYLKNVHWGYVGDPTKADEALLKSL